MLSAVKIAVAAAAFAQTVSAYSSYMALIPNGENIGKSLGHTATGYTDFGTLFSDDGTEWAKVCKQTWPGGSVTCGEALGDPCCTWAGSGDPDYKLSEPNTDGTTCASGGGTSTAGSTAASTTSTTASGTTDAAKSNSTASAGTAGTGDGSYCE